MEVIRSWFYLKKGIAFFLWNCDLEEQIKEKLRIEEVLRFRNIQLSDAQKLTHLGSWNWNILTNKLFGSEELYEIYEFDQKESEFKIERLFEKIHPEDLEKVRAHTRI